MGLLDPWRRLPKNVRGYITTALKLLITIGGTYLLLMHKIDDGEGGRITIGAAIWNYRTAIDPTTFFIWTAVATVIKTFGILSSCFGWNLLLRGQRIRLPFWNQVFTSFMIGRFLGTFLPSTIGLDAYTLYEAGRYSNQWHRAITAKALEKFIGIAGLFTGILLTLPFGYFVFVEIAGEHALKLTALVGVVCGGITGTVVVGLVKPLWLRAMMRIFGGFMPGAIKKHVERFTDAVAAYEGQVGLLMGALLAKFVTHFTTAVVYYFTALAIGVTGIAFFPVVFGSLIQILGTLFSPTIAGEGAREALQALLLSSHLGGVAQAVLSAALGFISAEFPTLIGGVFLWLRRPGWRPAYCEVDGQQVDYSWIDDNETFDANRIPTGSARPGGAV